MATQRPRRRVAITGLGVLSPAGIGALPLWQAVSEQQSLISLVTRFDTSTYPCRVAGQVADEHLVERLHPRKRRNSTRVSQLALVAAGLAVEDAGLAPGAAAAERCSVYAATALGGWFEGGQQVLMLAERGMGRVNPFLANGAPHHTPGCEVASALGFRGPQMTFSNGCPAGLAAIQHGAEAVAAGALDVCVAGGAESPMTPLVFAGMGRTGELSTIQDDPGRASRPFDCGRAGMVLSEGACFVVLEDAERAAARGARVLGEVCAGAASCDAAGLYAVDESGATAAYALAAALADAGLRPEQVDYVCSHANAATAFDRKESAVLRRVFADSIDDLPVSSIKGVLGHPFAAAGAFQTVAALMAMAHGSVPPTANLEDPDPECRLRHVVGAPLARAVRHAVVTSYGYGGLNAFLVLGHSDGLALGRGA